MTKKVSGVLMAGVFCGVVVSFANAASDPWYDLSDFRACTATESNAICGQQPDTYAHGFACYIN